ncbi:hypothetical protein LGK95_05200 [Clostridium algoriphilum]|uniref:hypothetical protein n=1 Tax=Clostridium algoriphilum TaxID=198347 RepID=UPI001CF5D2B9|nr:hypothetical protein [Clostridium algoriphilum]MCB2292917.1 hypothetical protein [Clostridium algoriphilum]
MPRKKFIKIVKKLICGLILVVYLTSSGIALYSKIVRASGEYNTKYTITNNYGMMEEEVNLLATKRLCYVIFSAKKDKESYEKIVLK